MSAGWATQAGNDNTIGLNTSTELNNLAIKEIGEWWEQRDVRVACQTNYQVPFIDKLQSVGEAIKKEVAGNAGKDEYFPIDMSFIFAFLVISLKR